MRTGVLPSHLESSLRICPQPPLPTPTVLLLVFHRVWGISLLSRETEAGLRDSPGAEDEGQPQKEPLSRGTEVASTPGFQSGTSSWWEFENSKYIIPTRYKLGMRESIHADNPRCSNFSALWEQKFRFLLLWVPCLTGALSTCWLGTEPSLVNYRAPSQVREKGLELHF